MQARDHDATLDGLRGLAALSVFAFHLGNWFAVPGLAANSWLAVDFFFCLSGYVLEMVYRQRLDEGWGLWRFMKVRLIRLLPMTVVATLLGASYVGFRMVAKHEVGGHGALALATVLGLVDLPYLNPPAMVGGPQVFPLNGPQYSLFLELLVNAFWAAAIVLRGRTVAVVLAVISLVGMAVLGPVHGGESATFWNNIPRVFGSYYLGTLTYAWGPWIRARAGGVFPFALGAMAILFLWPWPLHPAMMLVWIALLSPLVVATSAGVRLPDRVRPAALLLGRLSYPIYTLHYPLFCWINGVMQVRLHKAVRAIELPVVVLAVPVLAWALLTFYDEPLRNLLARRAKAKAV